VPSIQSIKKGTLLQEVGQCPEVALERYEFFLETYPQLEGRLSQRLIASYLGITPQALSRLRAKRVGRSRTN
jgi:CRP-like cAMP-binding protein